MLQTNADLARKLMELEKKDDTQFKVVFDTIRQLMTPPELPCRKIVRQVRRQCVWTRVAVLSSGPPSDARTPGFVVRRPARGGTS